MEQHINYVGVDLGQVQDYSALALMEYDLAYDLTASAWKTEYLVSHLERFPLGTEYPVVIQRLSRIFQDPRLRRRGRLIVDQTGVGRPVVDMIRRRQLPAIGVTITSGVEVADVDNGRAFHVPKKELVSSLLILFQTGQLKILGDLPDAALLVSELENFRAKVSLRGTEKYEAWREGEHDDLVLALALIAWYARRETRYFEELIESRYRRGRGNPLEREYNPLEYGTR